MRNYDRVAATVVAVALLLLVVLIVPRDAGPGVITCGTVTEEAEHVPAYCGDPADLVDRLDAIRDGRTGDRFAEVTR